ncbi:MAG TPA: hypothetical protein VFX02_11620 [Gammaproteobacteria bacterium]|nr:hypothetical protein [Gammaproteobacteria bacterium]
MSKSGLQRFAGFFLNGGFGAFGFNEGYKNGQYSADYENQDSMQMPVLFLIMSGARRTRDIFIVMYHKENVIG